MARIIWLFSYKYKIKDQRDLKYILTYISVH